MSKVPYSNAVGSLMYAMVCTRPDISHAVGIMSRYMHNPGKEHWQAVKWILRYIQKTLDVGLIFEKDDMVGQHVVGYCDSDYAGDLVKPRIPARPDWWIRKGFRNVRLRTGTLYLRFFFFLKPTGTCGYGPHLITESKRTIYI